MVLAVVQARLTSTRLPGKVLRPIHRRPMLAHIIARLRRAKLLEDIVVATTFNTKDVQIVRLCRRLKVNTFTGSEADVLDRYYQAARLYGAEVVVRVTSDCPLIDPNVVDRLIDSYFRGDFDYVSNNLHLSYPEGLDAEVFSFGALERAWLEASLLSEREHVTPYIKKNPGLFKLGNVECEKNLASMRWAVDEERDLIFVRRVYSYLYPRNPAFVMEDVLQLLDEHPELAEISKGIRRGDGYLRSLEHDMVVERPHSSVGSRDTF